MQRVQLNVDDQIFLSFVGIAYNFRNIKVLPIPNLIANPTKDRYNHLPMIIYLMQMQT